MSSEICLPAVVTTSQPTVSHLIAAYKSDPYSRYRAIRHATRVNYDSQMKRLDQDCGWMLLSELANARTLTDLHRAWLGPDNHIAMAHSRIGMLRTLATYGSTFMRSVECREIKAILHDLRFPMCKPREEAMSPAQVIAVIAEAHRQRLHSIAFAQALQFELTLRQKDVIGSWVPLNKKGPAILTHGDLKWGRGLLWSEIDGDLNIRHLTSKTSKMLDVDLKLAPLVMVELARIANGPTPPPGPMIINEASGLPYHAVQFRRTWRKIATAAGIPTNIRNMDSRASAISESTDAGADLEAVRHTAKHSNISMTMRYSRNSTKKIAGVMALRAKHRAAQAEGSS